MKEQSKMCENEAGFEDDAIMETGADALNGTEKPFY